MAITANPKIYTRSEWKAQAIKPANLVLYQGQRKYIIVHHSGGLVKNGESSDGTEMRAIQQGHFNDNFGDIGYNYGIGYYGSIMEGRSLNYVGGHCNTNNKNYDAIGVCVIGNFEKSTQKFTNDAKESLTSLLIYLCKKYNISPDNIYGHKDWGPTDCPGKNLYSQLSSIKNTVKQYVNTSTPPTSGEYEVKRYSENGTCYPRTTINFRSTPNAENTSNIIGQYHKGESLIYDLVVQTNKYVYVSWIGASSGARRYMAVRNIQTGERFADCV